MDEQRRELETLFEKIALRCLALRRALAGGRYNKVDITPLIHYHSILRGVPETIDQVEKALERRQEGAAGFLDGIEEVSLSLPRPGQLRPQKQ